MQTPDILTADMVPAILAAVTGQIQFARQYTLELLQSIPHDRWFDIPSGLSAPVAWHVGHLAVSQYGLLLFRIRGRAPEDLELIPSRFRKVYGRGSEPSSDATGQPSPTELLDRLAEVYSRGLANLNETPADVLLESVDMPYAAYPNKLGAVLFCPLHEHIHAGHIGLIRRALGFTPIR
jgi:hypothetical protein